MHNLPRCETSTWQGSHWPMNGFILLSQMHLLELWQCRRFQVGCTGFGSLLLSVGAVGASNYVDQPPAPCFMTVWVLLMSLKRSKPAAAALTVVYAACAHQPCWVISNCTASSSCILLAQVLCTWHNSYIAYNGSNISSSSL
jgi:hypothetical protein